jgi:glutaredoxin
LPAPFEYSRYLPAQIDRNIMKTVAKKFFASRLLPALLVAGSCLIAATAQAQQVYRIVGADGRVTFSDKAPADAAPKTTTASTGPAIGNTGLAALPYELRQVVAKFPVTFYAGDNCAPCVAAKSLLTTRGIPFTEKTVTSNDDAQALQRLSGENSLPFATIGGQQLKGFSDSEWSQFLDAAGYPKASTLPANYRRPVPTSLVVAATATATATATVSNPAPAPAPVAIPGPTTSNPAGIRF